MIEHRGTGSCVFVNTKVSANIASKHEGAVHRGRARGTSRTARVALIGSMCSTRIRELSELSKGECSQSRRCLQMGVELRTATRSAVCIRLLQRHRRVAGESRLASRTRIQRLPGVYQNAP
jgi:hypothetical protein